MRTYELDFNLSAYIKGVEIEANNEEEAIDKLKSMSIEEMLESGYVKDSSVEDETLRLIREECEVEVSVIFRYEGQQLQRESMIVKVKANGKATTEDILEEAKEELFIRYGDYPESLTYTSWRKLN